MHIDLQIEGEGKGNQKARASQESEPQDLGEGHQVEGNVHSG